MNAKPYTTTYTGRHISPEAGVPSLLDIAVGLARICRFAGQGQRFFSVLAHTLWMDDRYQSEGGTRPEVRLAILLHDAAEVATSDVPSPMKTLDLKKVGYALDERIFDRFFAGYGGYEGYVNVKEASDPQQIVKALDWRALLAEYWEIGPAHPCYLEAADPTDRAFLRDWITDAGWEKGSYGRIFAAGWSAAPTHNVFIEKHPAVREYLKRVNTLM